MKKKEKKKPVLKKQQRPETLGLILFALGFVLLLAILSFRVQQPHVNWLGILGYGIAYVLNYAFGLASCLVPFYAFFWGAKQVSGRNVPMSSHITMLILLVSACFLLNVFAEIHPDNARAFKKYIITQTLTFETPYIHTIMRYNLGGVPSYFFLSDLPFLNLERLLSLTGVTLIFSSLGAVAFLLLSRLQLVKGFKQLFNGIAFIARKISAARKQAISAKSPEPPIKIYAGLDPKKEKEKERVVLQPLPAKKAPVKEFVVKVAPKLTAASLPALKADGSYQLPSPNLLSSPLQKVDQPTLKKDLCRQSEILEETLKSFGIEAKVGEIHSGPTITSFEVHPSIGVKVQKIKTLENDIALNMQAKSIRIVAPIPGKAAVGVEVPALHPQEVSFKELLLHYQQSKKKLQIPILLGKGVSGDPVFADLTKMPHLLIAGATGSGKSVCINTIVLSILMNARPEEIRLLMIDPKKVELTQYSRLPHMIAPVITEPHGAYAALQWLVKEMQLRYEILKQLGLRNIAAFNNRKINEDLEKSLSVPIPPQLPMIVAMVDEFADLMMVSSADIETPIARIAQMARAVGIHLILATQRPSREVITGIIKANIPCRIAFKVASRINSQIILDDTGAESLLGNGDCLFLPPGSSQLIRAQGAFVSDSDINLILDHVHKQAPPSYLIPSFDAFRSTDQNGEESQRGKDALYEQALLLVTQTKVASTTYLQRKLKIGYARAASLMDELEENGVIGPQDGSKPRRILGAQNQASFFEEIDPV